MKRSGQAVAVALPILVAAAAGFLIFGRATHRPVAAPTSSPQAVPSPSPSRQPERAFQAAMRGGWVNGVALARYSDLAGFVKTTRTVPQVVVIYTGLTQRWPAAEIRAIAAVGALPLVQINPRGQSLADVIAGRYDSYLRLIGGEIVSWRIPVAVSFAHEANGDWYPWGCGRAPASAYIAAWRHVHRVIGTQDVTWVWTADHGWAGSRCKLMDRYPGNAWVNWIGVDGYLRRPADTFKSVFGSTVKVLRHTGKPVFLAEAGVPAGPRQAQRIISLYEGASAAGLSGIFYFDAQTRKGDYRPQDHRGALGAFRASIALSVPVTIPR